MLSISLIFLCGAFVSTSTVAASATTSDILPPSSTDLSSNAMTSYVSGSAAIESCYLAWANWLNSSEDWFNSVDGPTVTTSEVDTITSTIYSTFTLCDGFPRAFLSPSTSTITYTRLSPSDGTTYTTMSELTIEPSPIIVSIITVVSTETWSYDAGSVDWSTDTLFYPTPGPDCELAPTDCASLSIASSNAMWTGGSFNLNASPTVYCFTTFAYPTTAPCWISVPTVRLAYWPVTLASQNLCVYPNPIDITANAANVTPIASAFGMNITSDENCYISYPVISFIEADRTITSPGGILTVPSSNLQSYRGTLPGLKLDDTYSFNFADLLPNHVPILAYEGVDVCAQNYDNFVANPFCYTIVEDMYAPQLVYPTEFYDKYPEWSDCSFDYMGLYDPPTYLIPIDALTASNTGLVVVTTPASPAGGWSAVTATPTTTSYVQAVTSTTTGVLGSIGASVVLWSGSGSSESASPGPSDTETPLGDSDPIASPSVPDPVGPVGNDETTVYFAPGSSISGYEPATAVLTVNGYTITAISSTDANGSPAIVVGSQTLAYDGQAITTAGAILSLGGDGLVLSSNDVDPPGSGSDPESEIGAVFTLGSAKFTAIQSTNAQATLVIVGGKTATVGGDPVTLPGGEVLSAGTNGVAMTGAASVGSVSYSAIAIASATPTSILPTESSLVVIGVSPSTTPRSTGDFARVGISVTGVFVLCCFVALGMP